MTKSTTRTPPEEDTGTITARQMRQMHALLRDHGITGDKTVHDYLNAWLTENGEEPVESRSALHATTAARIIADLETTEVARTAADSRLADLRAPFHQEAVGKLPRSTCKDCSKNRGTCDRHPTRGTCQVCGNYHNTQATIHIDFVGHADVTARLLEVDPHWTWRPMTAEELATVPQVFRSGLWIMLTILGVERPGFGDAEGGKGPKEAIGDALRNAAMRFGVALDLWAKGDREWANAEKTGTDQHPDDAGPRQPEPTPPYNGPSTAALLADLDILAEQNGATYADVIAPYLARSPGLTVEDLEREPAENLYPFVEHIRRYYAENPGTPSAGAAEPNPDHADD